MFNAGDGQDVIREDSGIESNGSGGFDRLVLGTGIAPGDVTVAQADDGSDFVLTFAGSTDSITLDQALVVGDAIVEQVIFADGTIWTAADLLARSITANTGNDAFYGSVSSDILAGGAGDDTLQGRAGDDTLIGGIGNDLLMGGYDNDTYVFDPGDGQDIIRENSGIESNGGGGDDALQLGAGIAPSDVVVSQADDGGDFLLSFAGSTDSILLDQALLDGSAAIEQVKFADGTIWTAADLLQRSMLANSGNDVFYGSASSESLAGGAGNDTLQGRVGNDTLAGGVGNDLLMGGYEDDTYVFSLGDGQDLIREDSGIESNGSGGADILQFGAGVTASDIVVDQSSDGNDLILSIAGTTDQITIAGTVTNAAARVEQVKFADGTVLSHAQLLARMTTPTSGANHLYGTAGNNTIDALAGNDLVFGLAGNDTLIGNDGNDTLVGGAGNDSLSGGNGDDVFQVTGTGDGFDTISGGAGTDTVLALADDTAIGIKAISGVEAISSGGFANVSVLGTTGADTLDLSGVTLTGITSIDGGAGNDTVTGSAGTDTIVGNGGNDILSGRDGNDSLDGGANTDTVDYSYASAGWTINLAAASNQAVSGSETDTLTAIENALGGAGADSITGTTAANLLGGNAGADTLNGGAGNDTLQGGADNDRLTGGTGNDSLDGGSGSDVAVFAGVQSTYTITTSGGTIQIVDTNTTADGNDGTDTLVGVETAAFKGGTTVNLAAPIVLDLDGNGVSLVNQAESEARFDWTGDGVGDRTGWVGEGDGLLVYDRNGDGTVSGANELSFVDDKPGARSDLDGLGAFDSNGDGLFSNADDQWASFKVWQDRNGDGVAGEGELFSLADAGVASITLAGTATEQSWGWGDNITINTGRFTRSDGSTAGFSDVALNYTAGETPADVLRSSQQLADAMASFGEATSAAELGAFREAEARHTQLFAVESLHNR